MSLHELSVLQSSKMLRNLDAWLGKAEAHASDKGFEVDVLVNARLAPDQFTLTRQVQSSCDGAKLTAARLAAIEAPKHADDEKTIAELRARIRSTLAFLETVTPDKLQDAPQREIRLPFLAGKASKGQDYYVDFGLPNFYFHVVTAYSILRNNGVDLGKRDYLGDVRLYDVES